jgi:peptidoglycan/xylan/chitin deacetylase (PgdA/CDA1 family)
VVTHSGVRSRVTIVMYHFVRDLARSRYPAIKARTVEDFRGQLAYVMRHYEIVTMESVLDTLAVGGAGLPPRAALLTFDDGYADHFATVFPILDELGLQGSFFPPALPILENRVLDVNKIQFILASISDHEQLLTEVIAAIDVRREQFGLRSGADYWSQFDESSRYDTRQVTFIKRALQKLLPEPARVKIIDALFRRHVTSDESAFARELYLDLDQLRCMRHGGMHIGSHGYSHVWLNTVDHHAQEREVLRSLEFLKMVDPGLNRWVMCYPYGGYDATTLDVVRKHGGVAGLSVDVGIADLETGDPLVLPRLDTNDLPHHPDAVPSRWTETATGHAA